MAELDESQEALRNVEKITDSELVNGEDLLSSPDLEPYSCPSLPQ